MSRFSRERSSVKIKDEGNGRCIQTIFSVSESRPQRDDSGLSEDVNSDNMPSTDWLLGSKTKLNSQSGPGNLRQLVSMRRSSRKDPRESHKGLGQTWSLEKNPRYLNLAKSLRTSTELPSSQRRLKKWRVQQSV